MEDDRMTDLHLSPLQALRAAAAEILAECAENLVFARQNVERGIDPALATVRVRLALLDRLAEAADLFTPQVSGPCEQDPQLDGVDPVLPKEIAEENEENGEL
jgi:hypothetical protein